MDAEIGGDAGMTPEPVVENTGGERPERRVARASHDRWSGRRSRRRGLTCRGNGERHRRDEQLNYACHATSLYDGQ
jgi:hypothetical protein